MVFGDHGEAFGTHGQFTHASNIYEENLKVPCLLINPKMFNGERDPRIAGMIDVAPTITHLLKLPLPKEWQGNSLLGNYKRDHTFFIGPYSDFQFGSRFNNWKLIYNATTNQYSLFDIIKDPGETKNVADKNKKLVENEFELMAGWVQFHQNYMNRILKK
jgi:lipoteichoic acid synthase